MSGHESIFPEATRELAEQRNRLAPGPAEASGPSVEACSLKVRFR